MGTGASVALSAEKEVEIYRKLQAEYEECHKTETEDEAVLYERLRKKFHELTAKPGEPSEAVQKLNRTASVQATEDGSEDAVVLEIQVGDVVRCRAPGEALYFEGLVVEDYHDGNYMVDFGADQSTESVNIKDMRKVMSWNELELHDHVQVKDEDMPMIYSHAVIVGIHTNGTFDVEYEGSDERECFVKGSRIRKLRSNRGKGAEKWALLRNTVRASGLFSIARTPKASKGDLLNAMNAANNDEGETKEELRSGSK